MFLSGCLARRMTYPAPAVPVGSAPAPLSEVALTPASGRAVSAWAFLPEDAAPGTPALLFFHGNGENLETLSQGGTLEELQRFGVPFLAIDYPGYGRSAGKPSERALLEAADTAAAWMGRRCPGRPLVACGWSLGAAVAIQAAARHPEVRALVLLSPWTSIRDAAKAHFPAWLVGILLWERYPSLETAPGILCPALVIHGAEDDLIPAPQGEQVAKALPAARWVLIPGAGHNDLLMHRRVWDEIGAFLKRVR